MNKVTTIQPVRIIKVVEQLRDLKEGDIIFTGGLLEEVLDFGLKIEDSDEIIFLKRQKEIVTLMIYNENLFRRTYTLSDDGKCLEEFDSVRANELNMNYQPYLEQLR